MEKDLEMNVNEEIQEMVELRRLAFIGERSEPRKACAVTIAAWKCAGQTSFGGNGGAEGNRTPDLYNAITPE